LWVRVPQGLPPFPLVGRLTDASTLNCGASGGRRPTPTADAWRVPNLVAHHGAVDYTECVYEYLRKHAGRDAETGTLVTHAPLHPWLMDEFGLTVSQAQVMRTRATKALEAQGRIKRDHRYRPKIWILK
jgi:hypothetical protein